MVSNRLIDHSSATRDQMRPLAQPLSSADLVSSKGSSPLHLLRWTNCLEQSMWMRPSSTLSSLSRGGAKYSQPLLSSISRLSTSFALYGQGCGSYSTVLTVEAHRAGGCEVRESRHKDQLRTASGAEFVNSACKQHKDLICAVEQEATPLSHLQGVTETCGTFTKSWVLCGSRFLELQRCIRPCHCYADDEPR